jgi:hypothetical protein
MKDVAGEDMQGLNLRIGLTLRRSSCVPHGLTFRYCDFGAGVLTSA